MSPFRFTGSDGRVIWFVQCDPINESIQASGSKDQSLTLEMIAKPQCAVPLRWAIESELRSYRLQAHSYGGVEHWAKCRDRALEALRKYGREDLSWEIYAP